MRTERVIGIEYLRAFCSLAVVIHHLGFAAPLTIFTKGVYSEHIFTAYDFITFYVVLPVVPAFFLISNYLFFQKQEDKSLLFQYLKHTGKLAVFWIVLFTIFFSYQGWEIIKWLPKSPKELISFILSGGGTLYYFFTSLMLLTIITHFAKRLNVFYVSVLFIITTLIVSMLPVLSAATGNIFLVAHWNPLNFLPYPFAAILVYHIARLDRARIKSIYIILIGLTILLLSIADWTIYVKTAFLFVNSYTIPPFSRPSIVPIAMLCLLFAIKVNVKRNRVILFMSDNSLALYCLHSFFLLPAKQLSGGNLFISLLLVLLFSYLSAIIIKQFIQPDLIK